jgi:prevent-host-death family protein
MRSATLTEAKNQLSSLVDQVRAGETIVLTDRGRPVARLEPVTTLDDATGRKARLERAGLIRVGRGRPPLDLLRTLPPRLARGGSAVRALLEERRDTR